jgi:hypothetical protein
MIDENNGLGGYWQAIAEAFKVPLSEKLCIHVTTTIR